MTIIRFDKSVLTRISHGFHYNHSGAALTEFVITLPVWIILFAGLLGMGKFGLNTTANQLETQTKIWNSVITESDDAVHMTTVSGGLDAGAKSGEVFTKEGSPNNITTGLNTLVMIPGLSGAGSWGESFGRTKLLEYVPLLDVPSVKSGPDDVLAGGSGFPLKIVNDGGMGTDFGAQSSASAFSKVLDYVGDVISGSGALAAVAAGNRYGEVYAESQSEPIKVWIGASVTANSHANMLVGPSPLTGATADYLPFAMARLIAEGEHNYAVMLNFGESEWQNDSGGSRDIGESPSDELEQGKQDSKDKREENEENGEGGG